MAVLTSSKMCIVAGLTMSFILSTFGFAQDIVMSEAEFAQCSAAVSAFDAIKDKNTPMLERETLIKSKEEAVSEEIKKLDYHLYRRELGNEWLRDNDKKTYRENLEIIKSIKEDLEQKNKQRDEYVEEINFYKEQLAKDVAPMKNIIRELNATCLDKKQVPAEYVRHCKKIKNKTTLCELLFNYRTKYYSSVSETPTSSESLLIDGVYQRTYGQDTYIGQLKDNKPHGKGKYTYASGNVYEGYLVNDERNGQGKFTWTDGDVYEGDWVRDKRTGKGKFSYADGEVYEGEFLNDERNGKGKYTWPDGRIYEGNWLNGNKHGEGKFTWANGHVYVGEWLNGNMHGRGKYTWPNGKVYEGDFKNGNFVD